ncbi:MAG: VanZ family protein [Methylococcaceae bacterium]|nr:VanZ family protein [Methylococcaceae bacterium]MDZ4156515.1 VanZ family protein [Methylococcales bacterium]MDP2393036.1 VanZ family protein [Methylococcaceae bacterium]MDP3019180.1 VanZ family protein [Methylococcaceae bacterium]MDP3389642.1 VanZ family protein [Methylococcaceae bacterium]
MTKHFPPAALLYCLFVIYGSLVPLDYKPMPLDEAINQFTHIRFLSLGMASRADWVANILLYIPLAFLSLGSFSRLNHPVARSFATLFVLCFCLALAVAIEFTQLFFPPRTVSVNDLIAETLGTLLGVGLWHGFGRYLMKLYQRMMSGGFLSINAAITFYVLIYLALSFFPYDFVTGQAELEVKLATSNDALILSMEACAEDMPRCLVKLLVEVLVLIPLGGLIALHPYFPHKLLTAALTGFFLGFFIEIVQLFMVSGVAQGISVFTRMLGVMAGTLLWQFLSKQHFADWVSRIRPTLLLSLLPYIALVLIVNGFTHGEWLTVDQALAKLAETNFLPLYYFYYTTETVALVSLLSNIGTYLPIGLIYWAWSLTTDSTKKIHWFWVGLTAAFLAVILEAGKLFLADKHPDPTDIFIAFAAAVGSYLFMRRLMRGPSQQAHVEAEMAESYVELPPLNRKISYEIDPKGRVFAIGLIAIIADALVTYPVGAIWLAGFFCVYSYLLWRFPMAWLIAIPALLPILDFAPWTGRFFFDEFDLLVLTTLAVYFWRMPKQLATPLFTNSTRLVLWAFIFVFTISLLRGLLPLAPIDANTFTSYYSNYNSLRVAKGVVWALLLLPLLRRAIQDYPQAKNYFVYGVLAGLSGVIGISILERILFPGLINFATDYRITALFSSMHTGGGHIDAYLALVLPFITLLMFESSLIINIMGGFFLIAGIYTLLITFSRGAYLAFVVSIFVLIIGLIINFKRRQGGIAGKIIVPALLLIIVPIVSMPIVQGDLWQQRLSSISKDMQTRITHWQEILQLRDDTIATDLFGMGLGSYPRTYYLMTIADKPLATYQIETERDNNYLKLSAGGSLYLGQYIQLTPHTQYTLVADLRSDFDSVSVSVPICEKSLLYSFRCIGNVLTNKSIPGRWENIKQTIDSGELTEDGRLSWRPVQLALVNANKKRSVDVDNIKLLDTSGHNLLANGDFSQGSDFWFFITDDHQSGNVDNLWVQLLFDQGWLGIITFLLLTIKAVVTLCKTLSADSLAVVLLASLTGFFTVGLVASPFDAPRLSLLFFLIVFLAVRELPRQAPLRP